MSAAIANGKITKPPGVFRFRLGTRADLPHCVKLLPSGFRANEEVRAGLIGLWERLLEAADARTFCIIEDLEGNILLTLRALV